MASDKVNILLVDDQPAKLLSYETILAELGENLIKAASAREALEQHNLLVVHAENGRTGIEMLLKTPGIDGVLMDIMMPEMDG